MDELLEWKICRRLAKDRLRKIQVLFVYAQGKSAYCVDTDDNVFELGLEGEFSNTEEKKIEGLCGKNIISFARGSSHAMALSKDGSVYGWGDNSYLQLADGTTITSTTPRYSAEFGVHKIKKIACGNEHTLALSDKGIALGRGRNDYKQIPTEDVKNIVDISASENASMFLTHDGRILVCGRNDSRLGIGSNSSSSVSLTTVESVMKHTMVMMGKHHTIALTENGNVLAWGKNDKNQLGNGNESTSLVPTLTRKVMEDEREVKFVKIATHPRSCTSAALSNDGEVYVWGEQTNANIPTKTSVKSLDGVFARFENSDGTFRSILIDSTDLNKDVIRAFDNPNKGDCQVMMGSKIIHATKGILELRSEYLRSMLDREWSGNSSVIKIQNYSYPAVYAFIKFLYTDQVEVDDDYSLELLQLAHEVLNYDLLKQCVQLTVNRQLSSETVCDLFAIAKKLELKDLLYYCRLIAKQDLDSVLVSDSYKRLSREEAFEFTWFVAKNELKNHCGLDEE